MGGHAPHLQPIPPPSELEPKLWARIHLPVSIVCLAPSCEPRAPASLPSSVDEVSAFVAEFDVLRTAAVKFARGDSPESIRESMVAQQEVSQSTPWFGARQVVSTRAGLWRRLLGVNLWSWSDVERIQRYGYPRLGVVVRCA